MKLPTLPEIAGITMLALVTSALLVFPSAGKSNDTAANSDRVNMLLSAFSIDGVETVPLLSERMP